MHRNNRRSSYCQVIAPLSRTCYHMWSNLGHLQLMMSWPALHVSNPYSAGLIIRKVRNCLVSAANCCCAHTLHMPAHLLAHHRASAHAPVAHTHLFQHVLEGLALAQALLINIITHTICPFAALQVTIISPLTQVYAFYQHQPAQCLAQHIIITATQHYLTLKLLSPHTKQPSAKPPMPCTIS